MQMPPMCPRSPLASPRLPLAAAFRVLLLSALLCAIPGHCFGQEHSALCSAGFGQFTFPFPTGVTVTVGPGKHSGFATRSCEAKLTWRNQDLPVVHDAAQINIDVLGADLGQGVPLVAFQIQNADPGSHWTYAIYSLDGPPKLLRTITGADSFRANDADMDGTVAIWAADIMAGNAFDGLPLSGFDFPPTMALRFRDGRLVDAGSEFQPYYDQQISQEKAELDPHGASDFKASDGKLPSDSSLQPPQLRLMRAMKMRVLDIVWAYLYSGREQDAWAALAQLWPPADLDRIRAAILDARDHGLRAQVDGVAPPSASPQRKPANVFNLISPPKSGITTTPFGVPPGTFLGDKRTQLLYPDTPPNQPQPPATIKGIVSPKQIYLFTSSPPDNQQPLPDKGVEVDLVIDSAGKVHSVDLVNSADESPITDLLPRDSFYWKFVPASMNGQPVACRVRMTLNSVR